MQLRDQSWKCSTAPSLLVTQNNKDTWLAFCPRKATFSLNVQPWDTNRFPFFLCPFVDDLDHVGLSHTESPTHCPTGCRLLGSHVTRSPYRKWGAFRACSQYRPRPNKSSSLALKRNDSCSSASSYFCSGYMISFFILEADRNITEVPEAAVVYFNLSNSMSDVSTVKPVFQDIFSLILCR